MNYIRELNAFYEWLESNPCSTGVVALWFVLMAINNRTGWKREFTVANQTLQAKTGMSRQQLDRCRKFLVEVERITYFKSNRVNQAGTYSIVRFETQNETRNESQDESRNGHGMSHEITTLFKQNETKQNLIDDHGTSLTSNVYVRIEQLMQRKLVKHTYQVIGDEYQAVKGLLAEGFTEQEIQDGIEYAFANYEPRSMKYIASVIRTEQSKRQVAAGGVKVELSASSGSSQGHGGAGKKSLTGTSHIVGRIPPREA